MSEIEFSRPVKARILPAEPVELVAEPGEREELAKRFGLVSLASLTATLELEPDGDAVIAMGRMNARIVQTCAVSGDAFATDLQENLDLRFVPPQPLPEDTELEIELAGEDSDEIEFAGDTFDLGEAVAQSLGLAIDPYAEGPDADTVRKEAGITSDDAPSGPLADALAALKQK